MYKQVIIVRKDLHMTPGKMAAQVSHASMAFLSHMIRNHTQKELQADIQCYMAGNPCTGEVILHQNPLLWEYAKEAVANGKSFFYIRTENGKPVLVPDKDLYVYLCTMPIDTDLYEKWFCDVFTKTVLEAKNKNRLLKAVTMSEDLGMQENRDFFLIKDNCYTELVPEETDENGIGRTLTCIGFRPMDSSVIDQIGRKYQLFH